MDKNGKKEAAGASKVSKTNYLDQEKAYDQQQQQQKIYSGIQSIRQTKY